MEPSFSPAFASERLSDQTQRFADQSEILSRCLSRHVDRIGRTHSTRLRDWVARSQSVARRLVDGEAGDLGKAFADYATDATQRALLVADTLRERGNNDIAHEADGTPPVLIYDFEIVVDGATLKRPTNYLLLRIVPPAGVDVKDWKRPYVIIDPRAGHGAGIGGFKPDSQVGVALNDGHPVYFVAFRPHPEAGQTLADVTRAEAEFIREIGRRHPQAPKPIIVGNCQGGWATMLLAATNPDITGPLVINGAPLSYWSGRVGENPMRYNGGLLGGLLPALLFSDLGHGEFDGAHLVGNFEQLNPGRNFWGKYYDLFADADDPDAHARFLEFERWWGGFHFMNEAEIRWIVEQLFVGNRLARGEAILEHGRRVDLKAIRSPIIVFASHGDNITPPQQALNWICDTYTDENEIKIRGQRIIYMVHEKVGHLGIFVSSSIAKKEHTEMASTLKTIEALAPGLHEMVIEEEHGEGVHARFVVNFRERKMEDLRALDDGHRREDNAFAAVARVSEFNTELYDLFVRPWVQAMVAPDAAKAMRDLHPSRVQRLSLSDRNPAMPTLKAAAEQVRKDRKPLAADHPMRQAEKLWSEAIEQSLDFCRDMRDAAYEMAFFGLWATPAMHFVGRTHDFTRTRKEPEELRMLPEVLAILHNVDRGGFAEAVIRMLIVLANARGSVRRSRLERSAEVLHGHEPFAALGSERRARLIHEQTVIVEFEPARAVETLPKLLPEAEDRRKAMGVVEYIAGALEEMEPHTIHALQSFRRVLGLPALEMAASVAPTVEAAAVAAEAV